LNTAACVLKCLVVSVLTHKKVSWLCGTAYTWWRSQLRSGVCNLSCFSGFSVFTILLAIALFLSRAAVSVAPPMLLFRVLANCCVWNYTACMQFNTPFPEFPPQTLPSLSPYGTSIRPWNPRYQNPGSATVCRRLADYVATTMLVQPNKQAEHRTQHDVECRRWQNK